MEAELNCSDVHSMVDALIGIYIQQGRIQGAEWVIAPLLFEIGEK
jgi:hypothetical protein